MGKLGLKLSTPALRPTNKLKPVPQASAAYSLQLSFIKTVAVAIRVEKKGGACTLSTVRFDAARDFRKLGRVGGVVRSDVVPVLKETQLTVKGLCRTGKAPLPSPIHHSFSRAL